MRTKLLLLLLLANFSIYAQYTAIPDINFENKLISLGIDSGAPDGKVLTANLASVTELQMQFQAISDLTGIQDFTNLTSLDCSNNNLTSLDISKNTPLTTLNCDNNKLTALNLSNNIHLKKLTCDANFLTSLDVSNNLELTWLYCYKNNLKTLDVTKNVLLDDLYFPDNQITNIDLSQNPLLISLYAQNNLLTSLDISKNPKLVILYIPKNQISDIDISKNPEISLFNCSYNALNSVNLKNGKNSILNSGFNITNNPNLTCIQVDDATYSNTNWSTKKDATASYSTNCSTAFVAIPDQNFEQKLIDLGIDTDGLNGRTSIASLSSVTSLDLSNSGIKDISGIKSFTSLTFLNISNNQITFLDLSGNTNLETLNASSNLFTMLDLSKNTQITIVYVINNPLVSLNLRNGNNRNFILPPETGKKSATSLYTTFLGLTTLDCIQVDDADYSNTNWSNIKETTTTYSNTCKSLGIEDSVFAKTIIYPNPTNGEVNINNITLEKATIYNTLGQLVKSFTLNSSNTNNTINLSGLPKGVYYIYLINQNAASAKKIVIE
ncbi:leucine-rich repeat domain-containing protein [Flavobacterium sp. CF136]|uniref:leucine-rich repeat domain-containing protein n=1 Tax=Flavobacterium sp. (strain CF136) TaxID=1144313 RepID=UPI000271B94D|nr:leucine-rich repeat domain-containing protein [Flavobacterium sp. CF136]EJL62402.1 Por secretion system C-terminal sorting domain-containing protein [Flavobacterium sp. CF136]